MPVPDFPTAVDNVMISAFRTCEQRWSWAHQQYLATTETSVHLHAGIAFAKGLEVTRKHYFDQGTPFEDAIAFGGAALLTQYGAFEPFRNHEAKGALNMLGALGHYFTRWPIGEIITPIKPPGMAYHAIEYSFAVPIPGTKHPQTGDPIIYCGTYDFLGDFKGMVVIEDDKTATSLGPTWINKWSLANQMMGYAWGTAQHGVKAGAVNVRGIGLLKNSYSDEESLYMMPDWKLERFEDNLRLTLERMIRSWGRQRYEQDFGDSCSKYGGCPYQLLCNSPAPEDWIPVNFVNHKWDPLRSRD